jgi:hypothetical protein
MVLRAGDVVEVRPLSEILATLDSNGELENLPFMPEMVAMCGRRFIVDKVATKTCDTITRSGMRRMDRAVHLRDVRCDGSAHGGCQAACLIYWKNAWLRRIDGPVDIAAGSVPASVAQPPEVLAAATRRAPGPDGEPRYRCQATELPRAAPVQLPHRDLRQYVADVRSGNVTAWWSLRAFAVGVYNRLQTRLERALPAKYKRFAGRRWGTARGTPGPTPTARLDLQPGEVVRVRSRAEIAATLDDRLLNRGMGFDAEMGRFCGRTATVSRRVDHIIDEATGRMLTMKSPCVVLEGVICEGAYNASCPRGITPYWREIWLERIESPPSASAGGRVGT